MGGDGKMGNNGKMGSEGKMVRRGEKSGILGEKRGDRCLVINSHWASASKASAPMEQVNIVWHFVFHLLHIYNIFIFIL